MRDEHIKRLLDEAPLSSLGRAELAAVRAHAEGCEECRHAVAAAQLSSLLLKARTREVFEPSPFFQTRVLAAARERRGAEEGWTFARLWRSAGLLVSSMAATTAALAVFTFVAPAAEQTTPQELAAGTYSAESVILGEASEEMTYDQVLTSLYGSEEETAR